MTQAGYEDLLSRIEETEVVNLCREMVRFKSVNHLVTNLRSPSTWLMSFAKRA